MTQFSITFSLYHFGFLEASAPLRHWYYFQLWVFVVAVSSSSIVLPPATQVALFLTYSDLFEHLREA